jgi:anti-anti-sigma regulatory factor
MVDRMTTNAVWIREAVEKVNRGESEVVLDFSSMLRVDADVVGAMEELAGLAEGKPVKVVLRAVNTDIYRVLKQLKLTHGFTFVT